MKRSIPCSIVLCTGLLLATACASRPIAPDTPERRLRSAFAALKPPPASTRADDATAYELQQRVWQLAVQVARADEATAVGALGELEELPMSRSLLGFLQVVGWDHPSRAVREAAQLGLETRGLPRGERPPVEVEEPPDYEFWAFVVDDLLTDSPGEERLEKNAQEWERSEKVRRMREARETWQGKEAPLAREERVLDESLGRGQRPSPDTEPDRSIGDRSPEAVP